VSGCLNGSLGPYASSLNEKFLLQSDRKNYLETLPADLLGNLYKVFAMGQNTCEVAGTQDTEPENVVKVFKQKPHTALKSILVDKRADQNHDIMYELGNQYGLLMDLNHERTGMNKRKGETHLEYINRLAANDFAGLSHDYALPEFPPGVFQQRNQLIRTYEKTYYFALTSGEKKKRFLRSNKEFQTEPAKTVK